MGLGPSCVAACSDPGAIFCFTEQPAGSVLAGFPLTDTGIAGSFTVVSAHNPQDMDWEGLAHGADTLVLLMCASAGSSLSLGFACQP